MRLNYRGGWEPGYGEIVETLKIMSEALLRLCMRQLVELSSSACKKSANVSVCRLAQLFYSASTVTD